MSKSPLISMRNVSVRYKRSGNILRKAQYYEALKSISMDIFPGETLGVLGQNGAGKSTLLRVILGVIKPDFGSIVNHDASVSLLALQAGFDTNLSGEDNAILSGMLHGYSRKEVEARLSDIKEFSELGAYFYEPVRTYSSGMRARLGFSVSTITSPDVLLVDEVLSVGDKRFKEKAESVMVEKIKSNQTVVFVSHSRGQILKLCDRAIVIENGISSEVDNASDALIKYESQSRTIP